MLSQYILMYKDVHVNVHMIHFIYLYAQLRKYDGFALHFKFSYLDEGLSFDPVLFNPNVWPGRFVLRDDQQFQLGFVLRRWSD